MTHQISSIISKCDAQRCDRDAGELLPCTTQVWNMHTIDWCRWFRHQTMTHPYTQQKPCRHQSPWCVTRWGQRWSRSPKVGQSTKQASFLVTLLRTTVVGERTSQEIVGVHFGYSSMVVLWQGRHRSVGLRCTWWRHSSSITLFLGFFFHRKKDNFGPGEGGPRKGVKEGRKGTKKIVQFFLTARAIVRWPDRTTAPTVHVRSCAASLVETAPKQWVISIPTKEWRQYCVLN
jgi:hypothetical protein